MDNTLIAIDRSVISEINYKDRKIDIKKLSEVKFDRLLWSTYYKHLKINNENLDTFHLEIDPFRNPFVTDLNMDSKIFSISREEYLLLKAGQSLKSYSSYTYGGMGLIILGSFLVSSAKTEAMQLIGTASTLGGIILSLVAPAKISDAGDYLKDLSKHKNQLQNELERQKINQDNY
jgi:hypothetical protein